MKINELKLKTDRETDMQELCFMYIFKPNMSTENRIKH